MAEVQVPISYKILLFSHKNFFSISRFKDPSKSKTQFSSIARSSLPARPPRVSDTTETLVSASRLQRKPLKEPMLTRSAHSLETSQSEAESWSRNHHHYITWLTHHCFFIKGVLLFQLKWTEPSSSEETTCTISPNTTDMKRDTKMSLLMFPQLSALRLVIWLSLVNAGKLSNYSHIFFIFALDGW